MIPEVPSSSDSLSFTPELVSSSLEQLKPATKNWVSVLYEHNHLLAPQEQAVLFQIIAHGSSGQLSGQERSLLDKARDRVWMQLFKTNFANRNQQNQVSEAISYRERTRLENQKQQVQIHEEFEKNYKDYILFEDEDLLIINKPAGISSQGGSLKEPFSISNFKPFKENGARIVHRIDKETSGVLVLAKNSQASNHLMKNWKKPGHEKWYVAVVEGDYNPQVVGTILPLNDSEAKVKIEQIRNPQNTEKDSNTSQHEVFSIIPRGGNRNNLHNVFRRAATFIHVLKKIHNRKGTFSVLELRIYDGRKHQIRVSLNHLGYPIIGDKKYGRVRNLAPRHFLHAAKLTFLHPRTGEFHTVEAPLPKDMSEFLDTA